MEETEEGKIILEQKIEELMEIPGVGRETAKKLVSSGYAELMSIAAASKSELQERAGIGEGIAEKVILEARERAKVGFMTAGESHKKYLQIDKISTGSNELDKLIGGGVQTGTITECFGSFGSSKTQLAFQLAVNTIKPKELGGLGAEVAFIDTEKTARFERMREMAEALGVEEETLKNKVFIASCHNSDHQILLVDDVEKMIVAGHNIKLIIIDSLVAYFRSEYDGRAELAPRQQKLNKHLHRLQRLADVYNLAVYVTNQVIGNPQPYGNPIIASGGFITSHCCLTLDSLVITSEGFKKISDLNVGDSIFNGEKFVKVLDVFPIEEKETIRFSFGNYITASKEHRFPILRNDIIIDEIAQKITMNDKFVGYDKIDINKTCDLSINIEPLRLVKINESLRKEIRFKLDGNFKNNYNLEKGVGVKIRCIRRILNQNAPTTLNKANKLCEYVLNRKIRDSDYILCYTNKHRNIRIPKVINKNIIRLYGAWLCDGYKNSKCTFNIRKDSKEYLNILAGLLYEEFGLNSTIEKIKGKNCYELRCNSIEILSVFRNIDINKIILYNEDLIYEFCASLFDGDGSISESTLSFSQSNLNLINILYILLLRLGLKSVITLNGHTNSWRHKDNYNLNVYNGINKEKLVLCMKNKSKTTKFSMERNIKHDKFLTIKEIRNSGIQKVRDITVEGEYFFCNGILVHNCNYRLYLRKSKDNLRVAKLVDSPDLPEGEAIFCVTTEGIRDIKDPKKKAPEISDEDAKQMM